MQVNPKADMRDYRVDDSALSVPEHVGDGIRQCSSHRNSGLRWPYAAFFCPAFSLAHLARCAAAILFLPAAEMVRFTGAEPGVLATFAAGCEPFPALAHLALCACAIFSREAADIVRFGWFVLKDIPEPFNDSITEIA
jgi:hypothetical protein